MKKGFTLIELLAVISIIGVLTLLVMPDILDTYEKALSKEMNVQENNISDAAKLFAQDFCENPISSRYKNNCPSTYTTSNFVCISVLKSNSIKSYIGEIQYRKDTCTGVVIFTKKTGSAAKTAKTYLKCGTDYETDSTITSDSTYSSCF